MAAEVGAGRPGEDFVVIHSSAEMGVEATALLTCGAYAWFDRPPVRDEKAALHRALTSEFGALPEHVTITEHYPEPFFVRFTYPSPLARCVCRSGHGALKTMLS